MPCFGECSVALPDTWENNIYVPVSLVFFIQAMLILLPVLLMELEINVRVFCLFCSYFACFFYQCNLHKTNSGVVWSSSCVWALLVFCGSNKNSALPAAALSPELRCQGSWGCCWLLWNFGETSRWDLMDLIAAF